MFLAGAAGILTGGVLADRWRENGNQAAEIHVALLSAIFIWPTTIATFQVSNVTLALILVFPTIFFSSFPFGAASSAIQLVTPNQFRARVSAIYLLVINIIGIGLGATAASSISDYLIGDDKRIGDGVSLVALISAPLAGLLFWRCKKAFQAMQQS